MAEKNFFDLLRDKVANLQPSEQHRDQDWDAINERLDIALPQEKTRRRGLVLPLLLLAALLSSNAVWWQSSREDQARLAHLEAQSAALQYSVAQLGNAIVLEKTIHQRDTLWRTVYLRVQPVENVSLKQASIPLRNTIEGLHQPGASMVPQQQVLKNTAVASGNVVQSTESQLKSATLYAGALLDSIERMEGLTLLPPAEKMLLEMPRPNIALISIQTSDLLEVEKETTPYSEKIANALRPKFFKIGANTGWLYATSKGLMHEGGYSFGIQGQVGLSRHWALNIAYIQGRMHYKAHDPAAILGMPMLPMLPSTDHHYTEMDLTGQKLHQWDMGLRYTFSQPDKPRPYLGIAWASQTLLPFMVEYEIQHETYGPVTKGQHLVSAKTRLRNYVTLSAGLELPLMKKVSLTLEGFYQRQWKKPNIVAPDLTGVRAGVNWLF